jgi:hypothetical protein
VFTRWATSRLLLLPLHIRETQEVLRAAKGRADCSRSDSTKTNQTSDIQERNQGGQSLPPTHDVLSEGKNMSKTELKIVEGGEQIVQESSEQGVEFTEELPPLLIDPTSFNARMAGVEPCSVVRELSKHWAVVAAYEVKQEKLRGVEMTDQEERDRRRELWRRRWEPTPEEHLDEHIQYIKRIAARHIDWGDLGQLWSASPGDAIELWKAIRLEARDEFISGHYGARAFESADYMHSAFKRAQYLSVRDGLIEEWKPRGASEFILIDQMTQSYVMQMHWTEEAMTRSQTEPRTESYEFRKWVQHQKDAARYNQWDEGYWDIPYQHKAEAIEQAVRLVDLFAKSFQRAVRQLANIRLVRAKTARARRRERAKIIKGVRVA